jgi:hypothetical protein
VLIKLQTTTYSLVYSPNYCTTHVGDAKNCLVSKFCLILFKLARVTSLHITMTCANDDALPWIFNDALPFLRPKNPDRSASTPLLLTPPPHSSSLLRPKNPALLRPSSTLLHPKNPDRSVPILLLITRSHYRCFIPSINIYYPRLPLTPASLLLFSLERHVIFSFCQFIRHIWTIVRSNVSEHILENTCMQQPLTFLNRWSIKTPHKVLRPL